MWWIFDISALYWVTVTVGLITLAYKYYTWNFGFWESRGVPTMKINPFLISILKFIIFTPMDMTQSEMYFYNEFSGLRFGGYYEFGRPVLYIRDTELIRNVLVKDYVYFSNRRARNTSNVYFSKNVSNMTGVKWKHIRSTMTPSFSSGKLRCMSSLIGECGEEIKNVLAQHAENSDKIKMKELCGRYSTDVIAICAFGIQANTLKNPNSLFAKMAKELVVGRSLATMVLVMLIPKLMHLIRFNVVPTKPTEFFVDVVKSAMEYRETSGFIRNDFLQLMMDARTGKLGADKDSSMESQDKEQFEKAAELSVTADPHKDI